MSPDPAHTPSSPSSTESWTTRLGKALSKTATWLLVAGLALGVTGKLLGSRVLVQVSTILSATGIPLGLAWLGHRLYTLHRAGETCIIETYASMALWSLTPWGIWTQARQAIGEARYAKRALGSVAGYEPPIVFNPPFCGCWRVVKGGVSREESHSWSLASQRYAYDLVVAGDEEKLENPCKYRGLEDWATYGAVVVAAAPGRVVRVVDGVPDNTPAGRVRLSARHVAGNHVVIMHRPGLYTLYAHLRRASIRVRPGEEVEAGQAIGEAGNSGVSTAPHLHFQAMTTSNVLATASLPVYMRYLDGEGRAREGYPGRGDIVCGFC